MNIVSNVSNKAVQAPSEINIVIPNYNRGSDVLKLIESIKTSTYSNLNITVVDDCSTDDSVGVLRGNEVRVIEHKENLRQGAARNTGARNTNGDIIVFLDSDVLVFSDTIEKLVNALVSDEEISAVVGLPGKTSEFNDLCSSHFILRVYFNYINLPDFITHTTGTITAIRRTEFEKVGGYNELITGVEDDEFGLELCRKGGRIYFDRNIPVIHNKKIGLLGLIRNDMMRTVDRVLYMFRKSQFQSTIKEKRFISTPFTQILSALIAPVLIFSFASIFYSIWFLPLFVLAFLSFYGLYPSYLYFVSRERGIIFSVKVFFLLIIDMFFVHIALWWGVIQYIKGRRC
jgi:glycosyltransferase involved in cell wall biosynthesis